MSPQPRSQDAREHKAQQQTVQDRIGLLSMTLAPTPTIRQIIPARLRSPTKDDFVCISTDFIQLFEIDSEGHPHHVATKDDFDGEIVGANAIGYFDPYKSELKEYPDHAIPYSNPGDALMGPQMLTFTLSNVNQLFFLTAEDSENSGIIFRVSCIPTPKFNTNQRLLGNHIAVDPRSRAIAVAAGESAVFICHANQAELLSTGQSWDAGFLPVSKSRVVRVQGTILLMDFLYPPKHDPDRVILLMITVHDKVVRPAWVEWSHSDDVKSAESKLGHRILSPGELPDLLVPIKSNAAFLLATRKGLIVCENILTTSIRTLRLDINREDPPKDYPPSPYKPLWATWTRPRRGSEDQEEDYVYLITEDGKVYYLVLDQDMPAEGVVANYVGNLNCHIDSACAPFGRSDQGDILIVQGVSSDGCVWISECRQAPQSDDEPNGGMHGFVVSSLPNWSENLDLVAKSPRKRPLPHSRDCLFAPSGRQPYGRISELRRGLEAQIGHQIDSDDKVGLHFGDVTHAWILPLRRDRAFLLLLSGPGQTYGLSIPQTFEENDNAGIHAITPTGLDGLHATLTVAVLDDDCIFQVTESAISISRNGEENGLLFKEWPEGFKAVAATIEERISCAVVALRTSGESQIGLLKANVEDARVSLTPIGPPVSTKAEITSVAVHWTKQVTFAVAGTSLGTLQVFRLSSEKGLEIYPDNDLADHHIPQNPDNLEALNVCEDILIVHEVPSDEETSAPSSVDLVVLCGLRGGSVYAFELHVGVDASLQIRSRRHFTLGMTTVRLRPDSSSSSAFATCGDDLFKVDWTGVGLKALQISDVYLKKTDPGDVAFQQESVTAFSAVPYIDNSTLSNALFVFSSNACFITAVSSKQSVVPRNISVKGSPHVLMESKHLDCLISASSHVRLRTHNTRTVQEVLQFTSADWSCSLKMDVGVRVYSMTEWSFQRAPGAQPHVFIIVASGRPQDREGNSGWFQLIKIVRTDNTRVAKVTFAKSFEYPVTAISTYGDTGIVACTGTRVCLLQYDEEKRRFNEVGPGFNMRSRGVRVTTSGRQIHVTTELDSTITLQVMLNQADPDVPILQPVARGDGARRGISHTTIGLMHNDEMKSYLNLMSTRTRDVVGLAIPHPDQPPIIAAARVHFTAKLPRSVMRVVQAEVRPPWKPARPAGVLEDGLVGIATDGTIYGFAILDERTTNRLGWTAKLCQRNPDICPFSFNMPQAATADGKEVRVQLPPPGFETSTSITGPSNGNGNAETTRRHGHRPEDMHVSGDFLKRLLEHGGAWLLARIMDAEAENANDAVAIWVRDNLAAQKAEVDSLIREIEAVVDLWW